VVNCLRFMSVLVLLPGAGGSLRLGGVAGE
jgi:hypothetical protein